MCGYWFKVFTVIFMAYLGYQIFWSSLPPCYCWLSYCHTVLGYIYCYVIVGYLYPHADIVWFIFQYFSVFISMFILCCFQLFSYFVQLFPWYRRLTACSWFVLNRLDDYRFQSSSIQRHFQVFVSFVSWQLLAQCRTIDWIVYCTCSFEAADSDTVHFLLWRTVYAIVT